MYAYQQTVALVMGIAVYLTTPDSCIENGIYFAYPPSSTLKTVHCGILHDIINKSNELLSYLLIPDE